MAATLRPSIAGKAALGPTWLRTCCGIVLLHWLALVSRSCSFVRCPTSLWQNGDGTLRAKSGRRLAAVTPVRASRLRLPSSPGLMIQQAADTILSAYRAGVTRQWVRLRLDLVPEERQTPADGWQLPLPPVPGGVPKLHATNLPFVKELARNLEGESSLKDLRVALIDTKDSPDIGTLLYREAEDSKDDVAIFFLAGRPFATAGSTGDFLSGMKQRLVIMLNSEDAASKFSVENEGRDFAFTSDGIWGVDAARQFCETFKEQTYYYNSRAVNGWKVTVFRTYPDPWEFYIDSVDDELLLFKETDAKPSFEAMVEWTTEYEAQYNVSALDKRQKALRDAARL